ncbi:hypothetical protein P170DRAFT_361055 [Aspergillus steynii IBT 23096]|uniref:Mid2 domain-containing protein n=1 Tax=Aspergillus steynii IBT 23096 TaxID=1392250 RepID=A0A2I2G3L2_9EURO|nr:uncharacterized protein P170DRAFT_361055 [Aspergillus steynii IBT 23096]PLB47468.1 hypothetical protein P170DRAFT_361055 [Aspergillus steynii IBT 23096]
MISIFFLVCWLSLALSVLAAQPCYNLDGSQAKADVPCRQGETSNCCNTNDVCMSNGLCYLQGKRGLGLSRGSCTDRSWGAKCYSPCSNDNRNTGIPIINVGFNGNKSEYCCGAVTWNNGKAGCLHGGDPFKLPFGRAIAGVAALAEDNGNGNGSTGNNDTVEPQPGSSNHDVAIGVGVGVPLGVLALTAFGWALWERRARQSLAHNMPIQNYAPINDPGVSYHQSGPLAELPNTGLPAQELMDTGRQAKPDLQHR